jgi:biotin transport system substrate-specific component
MHRLEAVLRGENLMTTVTIPMTTNRAASLTRDMALILVGGCFLSLFAKIQIPLPFTPIPLVLQDVLAISFGILFGARRGACMVLAFLLGGALGFPAFAGGKGGLLTLMGPTAGYLIGYLLAAFTSGWVVERFQRKTAATAFIGFVAGSAVMFACGLTYLSTFVGFSKAIVLGFLPFIPGNLIKTILAVHLLKYLRVFGSVYNKSF